MVYVNDLCLHFLARDLALQGSVGFLSMGLAGLGYDPGPLVDVPDLGSIYAAEARELLKSLFSSSISLFDVTIGNGEIDTQYSRPPCEGEVSRDGGKEVGEKLETEI